MATRGRLANRCQELDGVFNPVPNISFEKCFAFVGSLAVCLIFLGSVSPPVSLRNPVIGAHVAPGTDKEEHE